MEDSLRRTKLAKHYYSSRFVSVLVNYTFFFGIVTIFIGLAPLISIFVSMIFIIFAIFLTIFFVVATFFLILLDANNPDGLLAKIWRNLGPENAVKLTEMFSNFSKVATPIAGGITIALSIILLILVGKNLGRANPAKDKTLLIFAIIFSVIGILLSLVNYFV